jgi:hypothetical protein
MDEREARHLLNMLATERYAVMGEDGFSALNCVYPAPRSSKESGEWMLNECLFVCENKGEHIWCNVDKNWRVD